VRGARSAATALALVSISAISSLGCGGSGSGGSLDLTVGNLVPLRGELAAYGAAARKSAALAGEQARHATPPSAVVHLRSADTESNGQIAQVLARQMVDDEGAGCVVGDWTASATFAVAGNVTVPAGVPLISPATSSFGLGSLDDSGLVFRTVPSDDLQAIALAHLAGGSKGRSLSIAARDDLYGRRFSGIVAAEWRRLGGSVLGPFLYDPGLLHHRAAARRIVAGSPDAFAVIDFPQSYARLAPDLLATRRFDPSRLFLPDVMSEADPTGVGIPPAALDGASGTLPGVTSPDPRGRAFDRLFAADPGPPAHQAGFDSEVFDATTLCFLGAIAASSTDGREIAGRIQSVSGPPGRRFGPAQLAGAARDLRRGGEIDYQGASGPLDLDSHGDPTAGVFGVYRYRGEHATDIGTIGPVRR
jgi:hypothetical protein